MPLRLPLLFLALMLASPVFAVRPARSGSGEIAEKRSDLGELRERIDQMKREIAAGEGSRAEAADQLRDSEQAISELQRELRELGEQRDAFRHTLRELGEQTRALESEGGGQQKRLEQFLVRQYRNGSPDTLRLLLSGRDPSQIAREMHYLAVIARARAGLLKDIEASLARKRELAAQTREQADALAAVEARQRQRHDEVARERDSRRQLLNKLAAKISAQRKEVGALQRDEQRLTRLVERLAKLAAARAAAAAKPKPAPAERPRGERALADKPQAAPPPVENRETPVAGVSGHFGKLRGKLRLPVAGSIAGRFGSAREGGGSWKGVFIRAAAGTEVRAVAPGQVVFADWMRGFGNLLILDHGDGYLTIYGYNDALLRRLGENVRSGDAIASAGNSGGHPESGLYFEIRYQGQPQDPMKWASAR